MVLNGFITKFITKIDIAFFYFEILHKNSLKKYDFLILGKKNEENSTKTNIYKYFSYTKKLSPRACDSYRDYFFFIRIKFDAHNELFKENLVK